MVRGPFLQDTTEGEFVLELEVLRAEAAHKDCDEHPEVFTNFDDIWGKIEEEED